MPGHWVDEGPLVWSHPSTRMSTETSFVLLIIGHGDMWVTAERRSWAICPFTSGGRLSLWLSCLIWEIGLSAWRQCKNSLCVRTFCPDSLHSHFVARVLPSLNPPPAPTGSSGLTTFLASSCPFHLTFHMPEVSLLVQGKHCSPESPYLPNILALNRVLYNSLRAVKFLETKARKIHFFLLQM